MRTEGWLPVVGYAGLYEVSDLGRVRSVDRYVPRSNGVDQRRPGRVLVQTVKSLRPGGPVYCMVCLYRDNKGTHQTVHRMVLMAFVGPCPPGYECCHGPSGSTDNRWPENLRWDTRSANHRDMVRDGGHHLANRTHCPRAHALVAPNLVRSDLARGYRNCLACNRARASINKARRYGRPVLDLQVLADKKYAEIMATVMA